MMFSRMRGKSICPTDKSMTIHKQSKQEIIELVARPAVDHPLAGTVVRLVAEGWRRCSVRSWGLKPSGTGISERKRINFMYCHHVSVKDKTIQEVSNDTPTCTK